MTEIKEFLKSETKISKDCRVKYWLFCKILDYLLANQFYIGKDYVSYKDIHTYLDKQCTFDYIQSIMHKLNFGSMKCYGWVSSILMKTHSKCLSHQKAIKLVKSKDTIVFLHHCMKLNTLV